MQSDRDAEDSVFKQMSFGFYQSLRDESKKLRYSPEIQDKIQDHKVEKFSLNFDSDKYGYYVLTVSNPANDAPSSVLKMHLTLIVDSIQPLKPNSLEYVKVLPGETKIYQMPVPASGSWKFTSHSCSGVLKFEYNLINADFDDKINTKELAAEKIDGDSIFNSYLNSE